MNDLIRQAIAAEADEAVDSRTVLAELHKKKRKPFGMMVGVATLTVAAAAAAFIVPMALKKTDASPGAAPSGPMNVLLIGTDEAGYTDALVWAKVQTDGSIDIAMLPPNAKFAGNQSTKGYLDGPEAMKTAAEKLIGEKIDHYASIKVIDFVKLTNRIGGVEVCLTEPAKEPISGIDLPAGRQVIKDEQAVAYLRQRIGLPQGELDRAKRHSRYLSSLISKITKDNVIELSGMASKVMKVDQGWDVVQFAQNFKGPIRFRTTLQVTNPGNQGPRLTFVEPGLAPPPGEPCIR